MKDTLARIADALESIASSVATKRTEQSTFAGCDRGGLFLGHEAVGAYYEFSFVLDVSSELLKHRIYVGHPDHAQVVLGKLQLQQMARAFDAGQHGITDTDQLLGRHIDLVIVGNKVVAFQRAYKDWFPSVLGKAVTEILPPTPSV